MGREDLVAVATRLFAVFLFVTVARTVPSAIALFGQGSGQPSFVLVALVLACSFAICALLWFFPVSVARRLLPAMREPRSETAMSGAVALSVGLTLIGVWILASTLPDVFYWSTLFLASRSMDAGGYAWDAESVASVVTTVVEQVVAAWLIFGSSGIRRLILKYRYGPAAEIT